MRKITDHQVNECNEAIEINVLDNQGEGGACHIYQLVLHSSGDAAVVLAQLEFQNGPIKEVGTNGITQEALIAVCIDRIQGFQSGPYACRENALALTKLQEAQHWLHHRTRAREARGVEGTHEV